jgi:hypothetical protein
MRIWPLIIYLTIINSLCLSGQIPFAGEFYRFDTIPNNDSIEYTLRYISISNEGDVWSATFPIKMIQAEWIKSDSESFNFCDLNRTIFGKGTLTDSCNVYLCYLKVSDKWDFNQNNPNEFYKMSRIEIVYSKDSILYINSKELKKDLQGKLFQRFTGY